MVLSSVTLGLHGSDNRFIVAADITTTLRLNGRVQEIARLDLTYPDGCAAEFLAEFDWPLDEDMQAGWFDGLPYPLNDMRPQGFLGRNFARHHAEMLQVPVDPTAWSDDHAL